METTYFKQYSPRLGRDMECKVYGHAGRPVLFVPCQDGRFFDFENFHMADVWTPWIESGEVMVFSIDTLDVETWSNKAGDPYWRVRRHEDWMFYIADELAPTIRQMAYERSGWEGGITAFGCSLGATHAANLFYRIPDTFTGLLALSGIYTAHYGFDGYWDELVYRNSPVHYLADMPRNHEYIAKYNAGQSIVCVGQGPWEQPDTTWRLKEIFDDKGISTWVDIWGWDVAHDWDWWYRQVTYFVPKLLGKS